MFLHENDYGVSSFGQFIDDLNKEFADLVNMGQITIGLTGIMETVPPIPDYCELEAKDAQATLITIAGGIEELEAQLQWLRPKTESFCLAVEPLLQAVLNKKGPAVDFTQDDLNAKIADLWAMEGVEGEDLDTFTSRINQMFDDQVTNEEIPLIDVMIEIPRYVESCPESTLEAAEAAKMHVQRISYFQTMEPWLNMRISEVCDQQSAKLMSIGEMKMQEMGPLSMEIGKQLEQGISILGNENESPKDFEERMYMLFT